MGKIKLLQSSSTHLALFFSILIGLTIMLIVEDVIALTDADNTSEQLFHLWVKLAMLVAVCIGLFTIGFYVTKRINTICKVAEEIIHSGDLSQRIPVANTWDDLSTLSHVLNMLLAEIEQLMIHVRQVSDNIAHDLRHPLSRLRNDLEELQKAVPREDDGQLDTRVEELLEEADHLMRTFSALLRIGNIEAGKRYSDFAPINLSAILYDIAEMYEPIALDKKQHLFVEIDKELALNGDKDLLFQAIVNAVDNAIKYTPEGGEVKIRLWEDNSLTRICISDTGPGVTDEYKEKVFKRFFRVEESRTTPGTGLGMSLVQAVVKLHKGHVALEDNSPEGLIVCMRFPQNL